MALNPAWLTSNRARKYRGGIRSSWEGAIFQNRVAIDPMAMTREWVARIVRRAFDLAEKGAGAPADRRRRVTCVDKSNVLRSFAFFRAIYDEAAQGHPHIERQYMYADAMTQYMLFHPDRLNVVVTENFVGDMLSDLASATVGGLGMARSANLGDNKAMFEPVHGAAPDIAGKGIANPVAILLACAYMLEWLDEKPASHLLRVQLRRSLKRGWSELQT